MNNESLPAATVEKKAVTADAFANLIKGIGPATERRLLKAGIRTVSELAAMSVPDLATLVTDIPGMTAERIEKEDWLGQARRLAQATPIQPADRQVFTTDNRQHYASFTLQLLLNEDNSVRRTQIVNNRNKTEIQWKGWDEEKILEFIAGQAGVQLLPARTKAAVQVQTEDQLLSSLKPPTVPKGTVHLHQLDVLLADTDSPRHLVPHDQPFRLCLTLDLSEIDAPDESLLDYTATVYAKKLGTGQRRLVTEQHDTVPLQSNLSIPLDGLLMPPGTFRLQAVVNLNLPQSARDFKASLEGSILQVY